MIKEANYKDRAWQEKDVTECFSGTEAYGSRTVFCDAECANKHGASADCGGPWYCARTKICQPFVRREDHRAVDRHTPRCVVVRSCANHTQCFPTDARAAAGHVALPPGGVTEAVKHDPFEYAFAGFTAETTCCVNDRDDAGGRYRNDRDLPCNAGNRRLPPALAAAAPLLLAARLLL